MSDNLIDMSFSLDALIPFAQPFIDKISKARKKLVHESQAKELANAIVIEKEEQVIELLADRYLRFRTLQSPKSKIYINKIYHPLRIFYSEDEREVVISENTVIYPDKVLVITGKAGQGKTTTLRKLVCNEILFGNAIPIIIFLREIEWQLFNSVHDAIESIPQMISNELNNIGIYIEIDAILYLVETKSIRVFFDGFDEVPHSYRNYALAVINSLYLKYKSPSIVTTRPHTEITYSQVSSQNADLMDLTLEDVNRIITRNSITSDVNYITSLLSKINNSAFSNLLKTPILVDIFVTVYAALKKDPDNLSDFYKDLFIQLSENHDRFKTSFERSSVSGLNNEKLRDVFIATCAIIMQSSDNIIFNESSLIDYFKAGNELDQPKTKCHQIHRDIIDKTSLIINDGHYYSFIHKTVLEYHAAEFLKSRLDEDAQKQLYNHFISNGIDKWEQVILFISEIDRDKLNCFYFKELIEQLGLTTENINHYERDGYLSYVPLLFGFSKIRFYISARNLPTKAETFIEEPNIILYKQFIFMLSVTKKTMPVVTNHVKEKAFFSCLGVASNLSLKLNKDFYSHNGEHNKILTLEYLRYINNNIPREFGVIKREIFKKNNEKIVVNHKYIEFKLIDLIKSMMYEYETSLFELIKLVEEISFDIDNSEQRKKSARTFVDILKSPN
jgi:hypothetical protein